MLKKSKNISVSGTSAIEVDGAEKVIGYFNANISEDGNINSSASIASRELYEANKSTYRADRDSFDAYVDELVDGEV